MKNIFIISNQDAILSNYAKMLENVIACIKCYKNKQEDKEAILLILHQTMLLNIMHLHLHLHAFGTCFYSIISKIWLDGSCMCFIWDETLSTLIKACYTDPTHALHGYMHKYQVENIAQ